MFLKLLMKVEALYLLSKGWRRSTMTGREPVWCSPERTRVIQTPNGSVICMQYEAVYRQRIISNGFEPAP